MELDTASAEPHSAQGEETVLTGAPEPAVSAAENPRDEDVEAVEATPETPSAAAAAPSSPIRTSVTAAVDASTSAGVSRQQPPHRRKRRRKPRSYPKAPPTAYRLFSSAMEQNRERLRDLLLHNSPPVLLGMLDKRRLETGAGDLPQVIQDCLQDRKLLIKVIHSLWRYLDKAAKTSWEEEAVLAQETHDQEVVQWKRDNPEQAARLAAEEEEDAAAVAAAAARQPTLVSSLLSVAAAQAVSDPESLPLSLPHGFQSSAPDPEEKVAPDPSIPATPPAEQEGPSEDFTAPPEGSSAVTETVRMEIEEADPAPPSESTSESIVETLPVALSLSDGLTGHGHSFTSEALADLRKQVQELPEDRMDLGLLETPEPQDQEKLVEQK